MKPEALNPIDRQRNVPRQVYDLVRERILSGGLAPASSINERYLSEWLGVSRTPIREAVRRLSDEGLITIIPNVGTQVSRFDPARVIEACVIRTSLECAAIEAAVRQFDDAADRKLQQLIEEQDATVESGDMIRNIAVDSEFHKVIIALSTYASIDEILQKVMGEIIRARYMSIKLPGRLREPVVEHLAILAALRSGDGQKCAAAMRYHLDESNVSIMRVIEGNSDIQS